MYVCMEEEKKKKKPTENQHTNRRRAKTRICAVRSNNNFNPVVETAYTVYNFMHVYCIA